SHQVLIEWRVALHGSRSNESRRNAGTVVLDAVAFEQGRLRVERKCPVSQLPAEHWPRRRIVRIAHTGVCHEQVSGLVADDRKGGVAGGGASGNHAVRVLGIL